MKNVVEHFSPTHQSLSNHSEAYTNYKYLANVSDFCGLLLSCGSQLITLRLASLVALSAFINLPSFSLDISLFFPLSYILLCHTPKSFIH